MKAERLLFEMKDLEYGKAMARWIGENYPYVICEILGENTSLEEDSSGNRKVIYEEEDYLLINGEMIYKYQNVRKLLQEIIKKLELEIPVIDGKENSCLGIFNVDGGAGTSTIARSLAEVENLYYGKRLLLVNLSDFGYGLYEGWDSKAIYEIEVSGDAKEKVDISQLLWKDELGNYVLGGEKGINPFFSEDISACLNLINRVVEGIKPDLTIIDFGNLKLKELEIWGNFCSKLICVYKDRLDENKRSALGNFYGNFDLEIVNMVEKNGMDLCKAGELAFWETDKSVIYIDYVENPNINNSFGIGISRLADILM